MSQVVWDKDTLDSFVQQAKMERELSPIPYGTRVLLRGLIAKPELNGQCGVVVGFDTDLIRCKVELDTESGKAKPRVVKARPENLHVVGEDEEGKGRGAFVPPTFLPARKNTNKKGLENMIGNVMAQRRSELEGEGQDGAGGGDQGGGEGGAAEGGEGGGSSSCAPPPQDHPNADAVEFSRVFLKSTVGQKGADVLEQIKAMTGFKNVEMIPQGDPGKKFPHHS
jgi:hypothetical protein